MNLFKISIGLCFIFGLLLVQTKSENVLKDDSKLYNRELYNRELTRLIHEWYNANHKKILSTGSNEKKRDLAQVNTRDWKQKNEAKGSSFYRFLSLYGR